MKAAFLFSLLTLAAVSAMAQGTPAALKCMFKGGLDLHASPDASRPDVSKVQCGSPGCQSWIKRITRRAVRTSVGTEGYFHRSEFRVSEWSEPETTTLLKPRTGDKKKKTMWSLHDKNRSGAPAPTRRLCSRLRPSAPPPKVEAAPPFTPPPAPRSCTWTTPQLKETYPANPPAVAPINAEPDS
jgi:hypothetical protein